MAWQMYAVGAGIGFYNEFNAQKKKNAASKARVKSLEHKRKELAGLFQLQTLNTYFGQEAAGAQRIARAGGLEGGGYSASALGHLDYLAARREVYVMGIGHKAALSDISDRISAEKRSQGSPFLAGLKGASGLAVEGAEKYIDANHPEWKDWLSTLSKGWGKE